MEKLAIIFDMDGVIIDNTYYHSLTWQKFAKDLGKKISLKFVREKFIGRLGREIMKDYFYPKATQKQLLKIDARREAVYRKIYASHIRPVKGLPEFLQHLKEEGIKVAMATAAPPANVKFVLGRTGLSKYFPVIVDATGVKVGKPNPDIFLKAAKKLKSKPSNCIVFEDALHGIEAAKRAGMKVVGIATSHKPKEIAHADMVIKDFSKINLPKLLKLISKK